MDDKIIEILSSDSVEIIIRHRLPYLCLSPHENYGVVNEISLGSNNITTHYKDDQVLLLKIKNAIIEALQK